MTTQCLFLRTLLEKRLALASRTSRRRHARTKKSVIKPTSTQYCLQESSLTKALSGCVTSPHSLRPRSMLLICRTSLTKPCSGLKQERRESARSERSSFPNASTSSSVKLRSTVQSADSFSFASVTRLKCQFKRTRRCTNRPSVTACARL